MRRTAVCALAAVASFAFAGKPDSHAFERVHGSVLRLDSSALTVGTTDGGVVAYDVRTHDKLVDIAGSERRPVSDLVWLGDRPWWICDGGSVLHTVSYEGGPIDVDLAPFDLGGPVRRLGTWRGLLVVCGESKTRLMDPSTRQVQSLHDVFPKEIADAADEGDLLTWWKGDSGLVVTVRRIGRRAQPEQPGALTDMALVNGWSVDGEGHTRLLGGYTTCLVAFCETPGRRVKFRLGNQEIDEPHSVADLGNVRLGSEGVIGLQKTGALAVPFYRNDWMPNRVDTEIAPSYAQNMAYNGSTLWWSEGKRVLQASLEDGSTDVYVPVGSRGKVVGIAANEEGAYVLSEAGGISQIRPAELTSASGFVRYAASRAEGSPRGYTQVCAARVLAKASPANLVSIASFMRFLRSRKVKLRQRPQSGIADLEYGDVVKDGRRIGVYVGAGETVTLQNDREVRSTIEACADLQVVRVLEPVGSLQATSRLLDYVAPIGLGAPFAALGGGMFVSWNPNSPLDRPILPQQQELASMLDQWIGVPYRWAGNSMDGTDCSGLVTTLYRSLGISLPRHSQHIGRAPFGRIVLDQLHFGDVLVFPSPKHCAIYVGNGTIIEAIGRGVSYSPITKYHRAVVRRFIQDTSQTSHRDVRRVGSE